MASGADGKQWVEVRGKRSDRCDAKVNSCVHVNFSIWSKSLLLSANLLSYQTCKIFMYTCCFYFLLFYECIDRITSRRCAILRSALRSTCLMSYWMLSAPTTSSLRASTTPSSSSTLTVSSDTVFIVCYMCVCVSSSSTVLNQWSLLSDTCTYVNTTHLFVFAGKIVVQGSDTMSVTLAMSAIEDLVSNASSPTKRKSGFSEAASKR